MSVCFITLREYSLQIGKFYCLKSQALMVNTSCPDRATTAQTQRGLPSSCNAGLATVDLKYYKCT